MRHNARPFRSARHQPSVTMGIGARAPILEVPSDRYSAEPTVPLCSPPPYTPRCADHQGGPAAQPELRRLPGLRQTVRVRPDRNARREGNRPFELRLRGPKGKLAAENQGEIRAAGGRTSGRRARRGVDGQKESSEGGRQQDRSRRTRVTGPIIQRTTGSEANRVGEVGFPASSEVGAGGAILRLLWTRGMKWQAPTKSSSWLELLPLALPKRSSLVSPKLQKPSVTWIGLRSLRNAVASSTALCMNSR